MENPQPNHPRPVGQQPPAAARPAAPPSALPASPVSPAPPGSLPTTSQLPASQPPSSPPAATVPAAVVRAASAEGPAPRPAAPAAPAPVPPSARPAPGGTPPGGPAAAARRLFERIQTELRKVFVGQDELVLGVLVALFSQGHVLIESVPGLGKTLFVRALGRTLGCRFGRIQFTADLMPSDITGAPVFDAKTQEFRFRPGPVFTELLLADEINRSPAKTHAALLEIMQEYRVTVDGVSHKLERPFLVLATQNPIESEGTYNLPEAQLDRFMFKLLIDYPSADEEAGILMMHGRQGELDDRLAALEQVTVPAEILATAQAANSVRVDPKLVNYINSLVRLTRQWPQFHAGASPRAGLALMQGVRTLALFLGRDYAVPDDVVMLARPALRHRVILSAEAEVEGHTADELLDEMIRTVEVPRL